MRKIIFSLLLSSLVGVPAWATEGTNDKSVYLSGHIATNTDSVNLLIGHWKKYLTGGTKEQEVNYVPLGSDGNFTIRLADINQPCRAQIADVLSNNVLFNSSQIIEPGDSVFIEGTIHDQAEFSEKNFIARFSGRGAGKYNCIQSLKLVDDIGIRKAQTPLSERLRIADSLIAVKEGILADFKKDISPQIYDIIHADVIGSIRYSLLLVAASGENTLKETALDRYLSRPVSIPSDAMAASIDYTNFLYAKAKRDLLVASKDQPVGLNELYGELKARYSGKLREKLIAFCLMNDLDMSSNLNEDTETFTQCLKEAIRLIKTEWLKAPLEKLLKTRGKGAMGFDFTLPADSSGIQVSLSDFKGKVVLLDMWGFICTACYRFAGAFHNEVYPLFKDNPDFKVVSIMLDKYAGIEQYKQRLRGQNGPSYSFPEYTNLYAGKDQQMGRDIEQHYNVQSFPFILLIDKKGRIFSSTVPLIDSNEHPDIQKLIALIKQALSES